MPEELVDDRTASDPSEYEIRQTLITRLNYNPKYSRIGGIGSRAMEDRLDLAEYKILYAALNLASSNYDYQEMKRRYDASTIVDKQRLLDDFNRRLERTIRTDPAE